MTPDLSYGWGGRRRKKNCEGIRRDEQKRKKDSLAFHKATLSSPSRKVRSPPRVPRHHAVAHSGNGQATPWHSTKPPYRRCESSKAISSHSHKVTPSPTFANGQVIPSHSSRPRYHRRCERSPCEVDSIGVIPAASAAIARLWVPNFGIITPKRGPNSTRGTETRKTRHWWRSLVPAPQAVTTGNHLHRIGDLCSEAGNLHVR